jgi:hypothetical protein
MGRQALLRSVRRAIRQSILHPGHLPERATDPGVSRWERRSLALAADVPVRLAGTGEGSIQHWTPRSPTKGPAFYAAKRAR